MLKLTSLALGLLTAISIVPSAQATPIYERNQVTDRAARPQVVVTINPQIRREPAVRQGWKPGQQRQWEANRRRELELAREREARARWEAAHPRHGHYAKYNNVYGNDRNYQNNSYGYNRNDRNEYRRDR